MQEAEELLVRDIKRFEDVVNKESLPLSQNQFDALVSFAYNLGSLRDFPKRIREGTFKKEDFLKYVYAKKVKLPGLVNRRTKEAQLYFAV
jgi:lysozyme